MPSVPSFKQHTWSFYHRHIVFFIIFFISLVKNTECYLPKKSATEWPRNKLLAATCQVPQNGYKFLILFFHSKTNLKVLVAQLGIDPRPLGLGAPQPWPLHHRANCWTTTLFSFYLIGFFHSETNVKELAAQPRIDPRPLGFEHHSTTTTPPWLFHFTQSYSFTLEPTYFKVI